MTNSPVLNRGKRMKLVGSYFDPKSETMSIVSVK
ncbi:hypothetical protein LINPERHAP1_LOCUS36674 [Linum perenne]